MKLTKLFSVALCCAALGLSSCSLKEANPTPTPGPTPEPEYEEVEEVCAVFFVNEGNYYNKIDGSLSMLYKDINTGGWYLENKSFQKVNGKSLGGTPNGACIYGTKMYITATDEDLLWVIDVASRKALATVEINSPREVASANGKVFVTSYEGSVSQVDTASYVVDRKLENIGSCLEGITACGKYLYVCNAYNPDYTYNTNVVKIDAQSFTKVGDITVADNPTSIINDGTNVYVISTGNYVDVQNQLQKIDPSDKVTYLADATYAAYSPVDKNLYVINSETDYSDYPNVKQVNTYTKMDTNGGAATTFNTGNDIESPCGIAVNPETGDIFITSYHAGAYGADYSADGYAYIMSADGKQEMVTDDLGVGPTTMVFAYRKVKKLKK